MCGEHINRISNRVGDWGSSPHVRGAPEGNAWKGRLLGIIPACAGSTSGSLPHFL